MSSETAPTASAAELFATAMRLHQAGRFAEAEALYRHVLALQPNAAQVHYQLANLLVQRESWIAAIGEYEQTLRCEPRFADAERNLATVLDSLIAAARSGGAAEKLLFVLAVEGLGAVPAAVDLRAALIDALTEPWGRPASLLGVSTTVLRGNPAMLGAIKRARAGWPRRLAADELFAHGERAAVLGDALLRCVLAATRLGDIGFERLLTNLRAILLEEALAGGESYPLDFAAALAQQCYLNDYVYALADDEQLRAEALRERVAAAVRADAPIAPIAPAWIAAVASYFPLHALADGARLLERSWPEPVAALLQQQIAQPAEEVRLRAMIPRLTPIEDRVSLDVQRQYAENPYPNWVRMPLAARSTTLDDYLAALFPHAPLRTLGKPAAEILIAGCGTGQQALDAANLFAQSHLLAIDLSLPSLAFAQRKAHEFGLRNIEFAQADILALGALERTFDSIEATGVLHHLADPWAGWTVLLGRLAPGGVMRIALYSELARDDVVRGRRIIAERGYRPSADDIRRARQELIARANAEQLWFVRDSWDFFSVSECRDLLFHVQEQRTTLPQIKAFLAAHGLRLLGFELAEPVWQAYGARFPHDPARTDLDAWHRFETEHPRVFAGMYQFWVQKADA